MAAICFSPAATLQAEAPGSSWVWVNADGSLHYTADEFGNTLPDFSSVGYHGGGVALPNVPVKATLDPGTTGDDAPRIQNALNKVAVLKPDANGSRGAVLLKRGTYRCNAELRVASGVVLRGEGQDSNGTILIASMPGSDTSPSSLIRIGGKNGLQEEKNTRQEITDEVVPIGARKVSVKNPGAFRPGDLVVVHRPATAEWIHDLRMDQIKTKRPTTKQWKPSEYDLFFERRVVETSPGCVLLDAPLVQALERKYGGGQIWRCIDTEWVREAGIEHLRLVSDYKKGEKNKDEAHAWNAVQIRNAANCWVRNVTALHFAYACVSIHGASRITVQDCAMIDPVSKISGGRRYSFNACGQFVLVQRCYTRNGRHDYVTGARVCGPNVFLDCLAEETHSDIGPHHRWATGTLYDNIAGGRIHVQDRGDSGTGHGWAGNAQVLWNCEAGSLLCQRPWIPSAQNWAIGCIGAKGKPALPDRQDGTWDSAGVHVTPRSLYIAQLAERFRREEVDPAKSLKNTLTQEQLAGPIWDQLRNRFSKEPAYR